MKKEKYKKSNKKKHKRPRSRSNNDRRHRHRSKKKSDRHSRSTSRKIDVRIQFETPKQRSTFLMKREKFKKSNKRKHKRHSRSRSDSLRKHHHRSKKRSNRHSRSTSRKLSVKVEPRSPSRKLDVKIEPEIPKFETPKQIPSIKNESLMHFTKICENLIKETEKKSDIHHPFDMPKPPVVHVFNGFNTSKSSPLKSNLLNEKLPSLFQPLLIEDKEKIFPVSSGKHHNPTSESLNLQNCLIERTKVVLELAKAPTDQILQDSIKDIDSKVASWHQNIVSQKLQKPLKVEQLTPYIPDLPTDYLMRKHAYEPNFFAKKLMSKMGWRPGHQLGKEDKMINIDDALKLEIKYDKSGLRSMTECTNDINLHQILSKHPVSALLEICQKMKWSDPEFETVKSRNFLLKVTVRGKTYQAPEPSITKKIARAEAAKYALIQMGFLSDSGEEEYYTDQNILILQQTPQISQPPPPPLMPQFDPKFHQNFPYPSFPLFFQPPFANPYLPDKAMPNNFNDAAASQQSYSMTNQELSVPPMNSLQPPLFLPPRIEDNSFNTTPNLFPTSNYTFNARPNVPLTTSFNLNPPPPFPFSLNASYF